MKVTTLFSPIKFIRLIFSNLSFFSRCLIMTKRPPHSRQVKAESLNISQPNITCWVKMNIPDNYVLTGHHYIVLSRTKH
jgi:hypothetical protein